MYKTILIDDEKKIKKSLKRIIDEFTEGVEVIGSADGVESGIKIIEKMNPDIVFLDIEMVDGTGFDLLKKLNNINFLLIFCTAFNDFAIKAFKYNAIDYILKPFDIQDVVSAIERAKNNANLNHEKSAIKHLLSSFNKPKEKKTEKLILKTASDIFVVKISDIYNCESESGYTTFKFENEKKIMVSKNLKEYEVILSEHNFIKTHQSHLVNMDHIERFHKKHGGYLILTNNREIPISTRKKEFVLHALENFLN